MLDDLKVSENKQQGTSPIKEADLEGHLINDKDKAAEKGMSKDEQKQHLELATKDYALYEALNVLKGMAFLGQR